MVMIIIIIRFKSLINLSTSFMCKCHIHLRVKSTLIPKWQYFQFSTRNNKTKFLIAKILSDMHLRIISRLWKNLVKTTKGHSFNKAIINLFHTSIRIGFPSCRLNKSSSTLNMFKITISTKWRSTIRKWISSPTKFYPLAKTNPPTTLTLKNYTKRVQLTLRIL